VFGRPALSSEVASYNIDVTPDGTGLPPGGGTVKAGAVLYAAQCAMCHGMTGVEGPRDRLVGGQGSLATARPVKTVGSYWQYAPTLYDYIHRAMPFGSPGSLQPDEVYSLVAFLLSKNGVIDEQTYVGRETLPLIQMPNRDGFAVAPEYRHVRHGR
jgi:cytochrome c